MKQDLTLEELIGGLNALVNKMQFESNELMFKTVKDIEPEYKDRIFVFGENTKGSQTCYGNYYSKKYNNYWVNLRNQRGLQTDYVDLFFTGELEKSIKPKKEDIKAASMTITDEKNTKKARFQEKLQSGKNGLKRRCTNPDSIDIFGLSSNEIDSAEKKLIKNLDEFLKNTILG